MAKDFAFYHGTTYAKAGSIMRDGLKPRGGPRSEVDKTPTTFLSRNPDTAANFAGGGKYGRPGKRGVVLQVHAPDADEGKGEFARVSRTIAPKDLKVYKVG